MSIEKRFVTILDNNIRDIRSKLHKRLSDKYVEISKGRIYNKEVLDLIKRKEKMIEDLEDIKKEINSKQKIINKNIRESEVEHVSCIINFKTEYKTQRYAEYKIFESEFNLLKELKETKENKTIEDFEAIAKQTTEIFNLAATNKEARNVLMQFQNKNWQALGVELPTINPLGNFDIDENGYINLKRLT